MKDKTDRFFDKMIDENVRIRLGFKSIVKRIQRLGVDEVLRRQVVAEKTFLAMDISGMQNNPFLGILRLHGFQGVQ